MNSCNTLSCFKVWARSLRKAGINQMLAFLGHRRIIYLDYVVFEHDNKIRNQQTPVSQNFKTGEREGEISLSNKEIIESDVQIFNDKLEERKQNALTLARLDRF